MSHNLRLIVAYEGTHFLGWQKTKMGPSIEESLEKAFAIIGYKEVKLQAASRTDAGVHAKGQVVNIVVDNKPDLKKLQGGLNGVLSKEIRIIQIEHATTHFHPTLDVSGKEYHYHLCLSPVQFPFHRHDSWHFPANLNIEAMEEAAAPLIGTHDFSAFCNERSLQKPDATRTIRSISIIPLPNQRLRIAIFGNHFLYKMVRTIVGTLVYVGCDKLLAESVPHILRSKDRSKAGVTAPAHGLCLNRVDYGTK